MAYELAWEPRGVVLSFSGQVSFADLRDATIHYQGNYRFDDLQYVIADYLDISGHDGDHAELEFLWALDTAARISNPRIRQAIVATCPSVIELATRYMSQETQAFPTAVFASRDDARSWIAAAPGGPARLDANVSQ